MTTTQRLTTIQLEKESFKFSSGHFTIFSATERENIHGHNFFLSAEFDALVGDDGLVFDYGDAKKLIEKECRALNEYLLLPEHSPHLKLTEDQGYLIAEFAGERMPFLKRDVKVLPVANISVEELSRFFCERLRITMVEKQRLPLSRILVRVFTGPGQGADCSWFASESKSEIAP